jgi:hypothetical protein
MARVSHYSTIGRTCVQCFFLFLEETRLAAPSSLSLIQLYGIERTRANPESREILLRLAARLASAADGTYESYRSYEPRLGPNNVPAILCSCSPSEQSL